MKKVINADELFDAQWDVLSRLKWHVGRNTLEQIGELRDGHGNYLFAPPRIYRMPFLLGQPIVHEDKDDYLAMSFNGVIIKEFIV